MKSLNEENETLFKKKKVAHWLVFKVLPCENKGILQCALDYFEGHLKLKKKPKQFPPPIIIFNKSKGYIRGKNTVRI